MHIAKHSYSVQKARNYHSRQPQTAAAPTGSVSKPLESEQEQGREQHKSFNHGEVLSHHFKGGADFVENAEDLVRKAALRLRARSLHKSHNLRSTPPTYSCCFQVRVGKDYGGSLNPAMSLPATTTNACTTLTARPSKVSSTMASLRDLNFDQPKNAHQSQRLHPLY